MNITVYEDDFDAMLMNTLTDMGVNYFYSRECKVSWLEANFGISINQKRSRLYIFSNGKLHEISLAVGGPLMSITFNEDVSNDSWTAILMLLQHKITKESLPPGYNSEFLPTLFVKPHLYKAEYTPHGNISTYMGESCTTISIPPSEYIFGKEYDFKFKYVKELDTMYYQVTRPHEEKPFVVSVQCYEGDEKDHSWFFTDIFGFKTWSSNLIECRYDYAFMLKLWKHLGLPGEFDMAMVRKRVEACYPSNGYTPQSEPRVFRREMGYVIQNDLKKPEAFIKRRKCS